MYQFVWQAIIFLNNNFIYECHIKQGFYLTDTNQNDIHFETSKVDPK